LYLPTWDGRLNAREAAAGVPARVVTGSEGAGMADGFQVTMSDLQSAAREFGSQATAFSGVMPDNGPAPVDGGSWVINDALSVALGLVGLLHTQLTATINDDASKLNMSCQQYQQAEAQITTLVTAIATPGTAS
jgi:hypothetical protein